MLYKWAGEKVSSCHHVESQWSFIWLRDLLLKSRVSDLKLSSIAWMSLFAKAKVLCAPLLFVSLISLVHTAISYPKEREHELLYSSPLSLDIASHEFKLPKSLGKTTSGHLVLYCLKFSPARAHLDSYRGIMSLIQNSCTHTSEY